MGRRLMTGTTATRIAADTRPSRVRWVTARVALAGALIGGNKGSVKKKLKNIHLVVE
jgi:hypothetical protein